MNKSDRSPPLLNPDSVPDELTCSICFGVPTKPNLLPCEHIFCAYCINVAIRNQQACPICRKSSHLYDIQAMSQGTAIYRIWSNIQVKCSKHEAGCNWTGGVADFAKHTKECVHGKQQVVDQDNLDFLKRKVASLEEESARLRTNLDSLKGENAHMSMHLAGFTVGMQGLEQGMDDLKQENAGLKTQLLFLKGENSRLKQNNLLFNGSYDFKRGNVVKLSQLISKHLENKPQQIESNRIYQCVANCYRDLEKDWADNPPHYRKDMQMLLSTCAATGGWFSDKQMGNIHMWLSNQFDMSC